MLLILVVNGEYSTFWFPLFFIQLIKALREVHSKLSGVTQELTSAAEGDVDATFGSEDWILEDCGTAEVGEGGISEEES